MVVKRVEVVAGDLRNDILEDLLIREQPGCHDKIENGSVGQQIEGTLTESAVVHWWLLVRIGHPESLAEVVNE